MQIISPPTVHPVIVIGSGASGGMAAWNLTRQGIDVLLLDADEVLDARAALGSAGTRDAW
jgi:glycine/D-amino acid oxidase-like deaminating enzyme